ncbi:spore germination protein KB [Paenibacillus sp. JGP012]|uniref:GerAB/ArcD/ProY family transporter n=1 Tax=Paenibacillus sp. JGP012 TaxID=2735914 RepID=UPI001620368D|nr:GerAB/ArcD/ProY family transporter [Paenibacillus sp. JGP012]MBB6021714.1 spore germination protein KB [Paenibacillus sp. JGP012]
MNEVKINAQQLLALMVLFNMGTALVVSLGTTAERDAWIATSLGAAGGIILFGVYAALFRLGPKLQLIGHLRLLGKPIGLVLGMLYIIFFLYGASRDLRDGGDLLINSVLDQTPLIVVEASMILAIAYVLDKGLEVLARTAQIFLIVLLLVGLLSVVLLFCSNVIETERLFPILGDGWGAVLTPFLKQTFEFPYTELICFMVILPSVNQPNQGLRFGFVAVLISGVILTISSILQIAVLGVDITSHSTFPLLDMIGLIEMGAFVQRLDVFFVLFLIVGVFFKTAIFYYACVSSITDLFHIRDKRTLILPVGLLILAASLINSGNFAEHIEEGNIALHTVFVSMGGAIPVILLMGGWLKKWRRWKKVHPEP